ncbi:MAG: phosphatase PAP2 family protein [Verrucomicrobia bacterium]|nr:phosphatase PAP2 family protein [Verrucomicrobiota bacterium]
MKKLSIVLVVLSMILASAVLVSWLRCQESYRDHKGRSALRYTQEETLWKQIDYRAFLTLNGTMKNCPAMQVIWGVGNHRAFDLFAAAWMGLLFVIYYIRNPRNESREELVRFGLYMTITLLLVSAISELAIHFQRLSPGATEELRNRAVLLTDLKDRITWTVKIASSNSFPGDHAMVLMFIGSYIIYRLRSWYGWAAAFGIIAFMLPRLAGGGYWLSDILAGSLFFYLFFFPLFLFQPFQEWSLARLRKPAGWIYGKLRFLERS